MRFAPGLRIDGRPCWGFAVALLFSLTPSCDDPVHPPASNGGSYGRYDASAGTVVGRLDSSDDDFAPLELVATQVTFDPAKDHLHVWMSIRNPGSERTPAPDGVLVQCFVPREVVPVNALPSLCTSQPPTECCNGWLFDHRATFGGDFWLDPGETSTPVEWILRDPGGGSFSFAAHPMVMVGATISGTVFEDRNADGQRQLDEPGIDRASVSLLGPGGESLARQVEATGHYELSAKRPGIYRLRFSVDRDDVQDCQPTTPAERQVLVVRRADGSLADVDGVDFGCHPVPWPPSFTVRGSVYFDRDADGTRDPGEPALRDVEVSASELCSASCAGHPQEGRTNREGGYELVLPADCCSAWSIDCSPISGYEATTPHTVPLESPAANSVVQIDFGMSRSEPFETYSVRGVVYRDLDADGTRDSSEPGIAGLRVFLSPVYCGSGSIESTTDETGAYEIAARDLECPLPWLVRLELPDILHDTTPNPVWLEAAPAGGGTTFEADFGVAPYESFGEPSN